MKSVAVVEDDAAVLDAIRLVIEAHGWRAMSYQTAESALFDLEAGEIFDCLVLDPHLSGCSGLDVARRFTSSAIPVVVLTARPDAAVTRAIADLNVAAVLTKPAEASVLTGLIDSVTRPSRGLP